MLVKTMLLAIALPLTAAAGIAAGPEEEAAAAAAAEKMQAEAGQADRNVMVCKKFPPPTGTRLRARQICKTKAEWDLMERDTYETMDRIQRKPCVGDAATGACN